MTGDLNVVGSLHELNSGESSVGDDTGATAGLGAPSNGFSLGVANDGVGFGATPEAEV